MSTSRTRCIGRFGISDDIIMDDPEVAMRVLANIIVVRAERRYETNSIEYVGVGDCFSPVPDGSITPEYDVHINITHDTMDISTIGAPVHKVVTGRHIDVQFTLKGVKVDVLKAEVAKSDEKSPLEDKSEEFGTW